MATPTKPKNRLEQILGFRAHTNHKKEELASAIKLAANTVPKGSLTPKQIHHYTVELENRFDKLTKNLTEQEVDILTANLIREAELHLIEEAANEDSNEEQHTAHKANMAKQEDKPAEKTPVQKMTDALEKDKQAMTAQSNIRKVTAEAAQNNPWQAYKQSRGQGVAEANQKQKLNQRVEQLKLQAKDQKISRGHSLIRRVIPSNLFATIARARRLRAIKKEIKAGYNGQIKQNAQQEVNQINTATGLATSIKLFQDRMKSNQEIEKAAAAQGKHEVEAINQTVAAAPGVKRLEGLRKSMPVIPPGEQGSYDIEIEGDEERIFDKPFGNPRAETDTRPSYTSAPSPSSSPPPGNNDDDDNNNSHRLRRPGKIRRAASTGRAGATAASNATRAAARAGMIAAKVAVQLGARFLMSPPGLILLAILLFILLILAAFGFFDEEEKAARERCNAVQDTLNVIKTGPATAVDGQTLEYTFTISDTVPFQELTIVDKLPAAGIDLNPVEIRSSWPNFTYDPAQRTITWIASQNIPPGTMSQIQPFTLTLKANATNAHLWYIINSTPTRAGGAGLPPGCGPADGVPPDVNAADFEALVKGQGRNTQILGDENNFVSTLMRNGAKHFQGKEAQLRELYKAAISKNINPLIMAAIWGVESGFRVNGTEFGCKPFHSGFASQVQCSANALDKHMTYFEQQGKTPVPHPVAPQCTYTDAFIYAYERYTPVCAINDANGPARTNFVKYFKELYGTPAP